MSRYITLQQPKGYRGLPGRNKPKLQAVLRRDSVRSERGDAQILAAAVRTDDPLSGVRVVYQATALTAAMPAATIQPR